MRNPLNKRLKRELIHDFGKYAVIFVFIAGVIALVSGFLVADDSMIKSYNEGFEKYNIEDGNFELLTQADAGAIDNIEAAGVALYENYYIEETTKNIDSTLRIFINREDINKVCLMEGSFPVNTDEIAIDRMYADNNDIGTGDILSVGDKQLRVTGLVALSDYSALFSEPSDMMFDAIKFGVAVMTKAGFDSFDSDSIHYSYSWKYDSSPEDDSEAKVMSEKLMKTIGENGVLTNYIPKYTNQAIIFTGNDMGSDKSMFTVLLYIVIVIIAFVFGVTTSNTISQEASVIGTLRASGYRRGELVRHYLAMPMIVVLVGAVTGNILGYTCLKQFFAKMYYGSYSLPTYTTVWNADAFIKTTVVPLILVFLINLVILAHKLTLSPLKFLRHELSRNLRKKAFKLNTRIKIFTRFRLRVIFQNIPNYLTLFLGIFFANFILLFGMMLRPLLTDFQDKISDNMICDYQYILKAQVETDNSSAEKYCAGSLKTIEDRLKSEEITIYGINNNSAYVDLDVDDNQVYISDGYAAKYGINKGDTITLKENYGDKEYSFKVAGTYYYPSTIAIFMSQSQFNDTFDYESDYYNGYFSEEELTDIASVYIAGTITLDDLTKVSRQLEHSMGTMMPLLAGFGIVMFILLIYLLAKLIIEKNAQSISMVKILGYNEREIAGLYVMSTTIVVAISIIVTLVMSYFIMGKLFVVIMSDYSGWLPYVIHPVTFIEMALLGAGCYIVVMLLQLAKIKRIPKSAALKNVE